VLDHRPGGAKILDERFMVSAARDKTTGAAACLPVARATGPVGCIVAANLLAWDGRHRSCGICGVR
jgi:hypothetical protein